jgi:hypothetical protein
MRVRYHSDPQVRLYFDTLSMCTQRMPAQSSLVVAPLGGWFSTLADADTRQEY